MMQLRGYQQEIKSAVYGAWGAGNQNVTVELATGGGKTAVMAAIVHEHDGPSCTIAHRQELVGQMSQALAREGVRHNVVAASNVLKMIVGKHTKEFGRSYYDPSARAAVAGVDTLIRRKDLDVWARSVTLVNTDECHHLLRDNKWGRAFDMFTHPARRGLGVSATIERGDGKGIGRWAEGVMDVVVRGPGMRWLINNGYLCDYQILTLPSTLDRAHLLIGRSGEINPDQLREETRASSVLGDVVEHYLTYARGKRGITFADCVENAATITANFNARGVPAVMLTGDSPDLEREQTIDRFVRGEILQIVNVALFDEGFDCPAVEVVSDAAATESYGRYAQRFGRMLRILAGKQFGMYIDHVGNVMRHGLPDRVRRTSLDSRATRSQAPDDAIPLRTCTHCHQPYERVLLQCPNCGTAPEVVDRGGVHQVDGDLAMLPPEILEAMRGEVDRIDGVRVAVPYGVAPYVRKGIESRHFERQDAQVILRAMIDGYGGLPTHRNIREAQRRFYHTFGTDVLTAQTLGATAALALADRIREKMLIDGYVISG